MKKRIALSAVIIVAVAALAAAPLIAGPGHGRRGFGGEGHAFGVLGHLQHVKEELDLSEQQVDQLAAIVAEVREQNAQYREQLHGGLKGAAEVLLANPNDLAGAQAVLDQQEAAVRALKMNILNATSKAFGVLNAEQRAKLGELIEKHAERRGRRGR